MASADAPDGDAEGQKVKPKRKPLPPDLPRIDQVLTPGNACTCGGQLRTIAEDVTEELEYVPGWFVVNRIVRPRMAYWDCDRIIQSALPSRPIERGRPGPGLLAHVLVSKYANHCPLYRQSQIYGREGIDLDRSTLADWVGRSAALLEPLADAIGRHVRAGQAILADDTPIRMQSKGKCATARVWTYVRDERPWGGVDPPAAAARTDQARGRGEAFSCPLAIRTVFRICASTLWSFISWWRRRESGFREKPNFTSCAPFGSLNCMA
ncbi:Transposase [Leisingera aquaemixtae]|uniref:Transposase n=1 Tax=Leisingera aquaemixtae TaxID=1396826 RepID=A0A0P1HAA8_9RHOB|nr:IS66 family transposase [Leisingera aquaemixtae]CUI00342.1 Transposase [Leisingera aquaemixtae]